LLPEEKWGQCSEPTPEIEYRKSPAEESQQPKISETEKVFQESPAVQEVLPPLDLDLEAFPM
jgi:hypothetical protein